MIHEDSDKYASRLASVAGTRLLFNTLTELEDFLGNHAIHTNGMRRSFPTHVKRRGAYRDCRVEVEMLTDGTFDLDWLMRHYERASSFFRANLARRKDSDSLARHLLTAYHALVAGREPDRRWHALAQSVHDGEVNIALLTLLLLRAIPVCDSKSGDVTDIDEQFRRVTRFLRDYTAGCGLFDVLPVIRIAEEDTRRTRLMLIYHTMDILDTYEAFLSDRNMAQACLQVRSSNVDLDVEGIWTEEGSTCFWEFESSVDRGVFFATRYCYESAHLLISTCYVMQFLHGEDGRVNVHVQHPLAMKHRVQRRPCGDEDNGWYMTEHALEAVPDELRLVRILQSESWPYRMSLRRVGEEGEMRYRDELRRCVTIDAFEDCRYVFRKGIYAITQMAVYVVDEREDCFYRLPRYTEHEFEQLDLDDNVGILEMGREGEERRYLAIDDRMLYIPLKPKSLSPYGIDRTTDLT